jgi:hypothetical protein
MGRRKMSAAAAPSRSWSNVGGSVIPGEIRGFFFDACGGVTVKCWGSGLACLCFYGNRFDSGGQGERYEVEM